MHYELVTFDRLIKQKSQHRDLKKMQTWINESRQETDRIKEVFMTELFSEKSKITIERYIQIHQKALLKLGELLEESAKQVSGKIVGFYSQLIGCIEDLLHFMEDHFSEYLCLDCNMPTHLKQKAINGIAIKLPAIEQGLKELKVDEKLSDIILQPFNEFFDQESDFTYQQVYFINGMANTILKLSARKKKVINSNKTLVEALYLVNFNNLAFYQYCKDQVLQIIQEKESIIEQLYKLARQQKYFSRLKTNGALVYNSQRIDITTMLADWLQDMIMLKERELQVSLHQMKSGLGEHGADSQKVVTNCTVPELGLPLAYLLKRGFFKIRIKRH